MKVYIFLVMAVLAWGSVSVLEKTIIDKVNPWAFIFWRWVGLGICLALILIFSGKIRALVFSLDMKMIAIASATGVISWLIAQFFFFKALEIEQVGLVVPFTATFPLVTMIMAYFVLREPITAMKLIGTGMIIAGCFLLTKEIGTS